MARFTVTARVGPQVRKERCGSFDEALETLAAYVNAGGARPAAPRNVLGRDYEPVGQVAGRFEVRGPGVRGGIDVRGDGSAQAYTGRIRKQVVEPEGHETAAQALERALRTG